MLICFEDLKGDIQGCGHAGEPPKNDRWVVEASPNMLHPKCQVIFPQSNSGTPLEFGSCQNFYKANQVLHGTCREHFQVHKLAARLSCFSELHDSSPAIEVI